MKPAFFGLFATFLWIHCGPQVGILEILEKTRSADRRIADEAREKLDHYVLERRVALFRKGLESGGEDDRALLLILLGRIGTPEAISILSEYLSEDHRFPVFRDPFTGGHRSREVDSRILVARILSRLGTPPGAIDNVLPSLRSPDPDLRWQTVYVLGVLGDVAAASHLVPLVEDPNPDVQRAAVEILGKLRDPVAIPALLKRAVGSEAPSRRLALSILQRFHEPEILERLLDAFPAETDPEIRHSMLSVMGRYPDRRIVPPLIDALGSPDPNLHSMAERRLCELTHRSPGLPQRDWKRWWEEEGESFEFPP